MPRTEIPNFTTPDAAGAAGSDLVWNTVAESYHAHAKPIEVAVTNNSATVGAAGLPPTSRPPSPAQTSTSWTGHTFTPVPPLPPLEADTIRVRDKQWMHILETALGPRRGKAVAELAAYLHARGHSASWLTASELAVDLLSTESDDTCDTVTALLGDHWQGNVGELLAAARNL